MGFMGVMRQWIEVERADGKGNDEKWRLRWAVVGCKAVSGEHSGVNLGQYFVRICKRIGILGDQQSKVSSRT
jgi:hypothetical protein